VQIDIIRKRHRNIIAMVQSQLYHDAFERFRKQANAEIKEPKDRAVLDEFLQ